MKIVDEQAHLYTGDDLAVIVRAMSILGVYEKDVLSTLLTHSQMIQEELSIANVCQIFQAMADLKHYDRNVAMGLLESCRTKEFKRKEVVKMSISLAKLGHRDDDTLDALADRAVILLESFTPAEAVAVLHSFLILRYFDQLLIEKLWTCITDAPAQNYGVDSLLELYQIDLCLSIERPSWPRVMSSILKSRIHDAREFFCLEGEVNINGDLHQQVAQTLVEMDVSHKSGELVGGLIVDIFVTDPKASVAKAFSREGGPLELGAATWGVREEGEQGRKPVETQLQGVVLELDGPSKFYHHQDGVSSVGARNTMINGRDLFKRRLLEEQGIGWVSIPYYEWELLMSSQERSEYITKKLYLRL